MKKLYRKSTVHPSPPIISDQLSFLPATILTLTVALSPQDREVLAYLISCSSSNPNTATASHKSGAVKVAASGSGGCRSSYGGCRDHPPLFSCNCFRCYTSYWVRWDESPNRQLIDEIIDAFEDWLAQNSKSGAAGNVGKVKNSNNRKDKKNKKGSNPKNRSDELKSPRNGKDESSESEPVGEREKTDSTGGDSGSGNGNSNVGMEEEKGSVRRFVSFIGERIWGVWNQE